MQVKVHNKNVHPFTGIWDEKTYVIPAGGYVEMDYESAKRFIKHAHNPIMRTGQGDDPRGFQMLSISEDDHRKARAFGDQKVTMWRSHADGSYHASQEALEKNDKQYESRKAKEKEK